MSHPPVPFNEAARLHDLKFYDILDSEKESMFTELVELAASVSGCPMAALTFIDQDRQWIKAKVNIEFDHTTRNEAFCAHTIFEERVLVVEDAPADPRFKNNPLVTGAPGIHFYAGAPVFSTSGNALGAVCVLDKKARQVSPQSLRSLQIIARQISQLLEMRLKNKWLENNIDQLAELEKQKRFNIVAEVDREKSVIAETLHESLAQNLSAVRLYIDLATVGGPLSSGYLTKAIHNIDETINLARKVSYQIAPARDQIDFLNILSEAVHKFGEENNVIVDFDYTEEQIRDRLPMKTMQMLFYILQAQLRDCILSGATSISVSLEYTDAVYMVVASNSPNLKACDELTLERINQIGSLISASDKYHMRLRA